MNRTHAICAGAIVAGAAIVISSAPAGDLGPPNGAVSPSMKTLDEVEPRIPLGLDTTPGDLDSLYKITAPGSYYLTKEISVRSGDSGIEIATSDVSIDLMGFRIVGLTGSVSGIRTTPSTYHVIVRNGHITDFDSHGIDAFGTKDAVIESVVASSNTGKGIYVGEDATIIGCRSTNNSDDGIQTNTRALIRDCIVRDNLGDGIVSSSSTHIGCLVSHNGGEGFRGSGTYAQCISDNNDDNGFEINAASTLQNCRARQGLQNGFFLANEGITLINCTAQSNTLAGFTSSNPGCSSFVSCAADSNGTDGFYAPSGSTLQACVARKNGEEGISGGYGLTITNCTAKRNTGDGIRVSYRCLVIGNTCEENGYDTGDGAGIHASGSGNRIDGNNVITNDRGIDVDLPSNVIVRNSATDNTTNYDIAASNIVGPFVNGSNIATNNSPHANYDY